MNIPIVLAAFGTTTRALNTYQFIDGVIREQFREHDIRWAWSSRMVRDRIKARRDINMKHPYEVLADLIHEGCRWAVVQSLHMMCGHEFYRLIEEVHGCDIRSSVGLPLLAGPEDYKRISRILINTHKPEDDEALILVGHGTDHPSWAGYMAMNQVFSDAVGTGVHVGMIEGDHLSPEMILAKIKKNGFKRVRLAAMMLVAGVHFQDDIDGGEDSWRAFFENAGFEVTLDRQGMGMDPAVVELFCDHIREALAVIPDNDFRECRIPGR